jgi:hypothetical protein
MRRIMHIAPAEFAKPVGPFRFAGMSAILAISFAGFAMAADECGQAVNFEDVEIGIVVDEIARRTGARFIIDPHVGGRVTIVASAAGGLCPEEALDIFLDALPAYGFAATPVTNGAYRIAPAASVAANKALQAGRPVTLSSKPGAIRLSALRQDNAGEALTVDQVSLPSATPARQEPSAPLKEDDGGTVAMASVFYGAHLSSYRTEASAIAGWKELLAEYPVELDAMTAKLAEFSDPARGDFQRIIAGPFPSRAEAERFCRKLDGAGTYCAVMPFSGRPLPE